MKKIGIDLGGTTIKGALFDGENIIKECAVPTHGSEGREAIFASLFAAIDKLFQKDVQAIGVSSAGNIDPATGKCVYATDNLLGWTGADIRSAVEQKYAVLCKADNDAVCALKGELLFLPTLKDVTMLTFGTGVGGASLVCGNILRGRAFDAARWGHVCLEPNGRACNCGRAGCAETYLSATALTLEGKKKIPALASCKELFERYAAGEKAAKEVLQEFGHYLNLLLNLIRTALSPELILLGGGVAQSEEIFRELIENQADIAFARLGNRAGIYGAISEL